MSKVSALLLFESEISGKLGFLFLPVVSAALPQSRSYCCSSGLVNEKFLNSSWFIIGRIPSSMGVRMGSSFIKSGSKLLTSSLDFCQTEKAKERDVKRMYHLLDPRSASSLV